MAPLPVAVSQSVPMRMPSKSAQTLSAEEQDLVDADQLFLDAILSGNVAHCLVTQARQMRSRCN